MRLRTYQADALTAWQAALRAAPTHGIVAHATGLGKTVLAAAWIAERAAQERALFVAHRDELITQAVTRLADWIDPTTIGVVKAERNESHKPVVVASLQSLVRRLDDCPPFDLAVIDECHHAEARTYQRLLDWLGPNMPVLGLSATPHRADGKPFDTTWPAGIVHQVTLRDGIQRGYLSDVRSVRIQLGGEVAWSTRVRRGDFVERDLEDCFREGDGPRIVARAIAEHARDRPTIVFTPTVASAEETDAACQDLGLTSVCISGDMMPVRRFNGITSYLQGKTHVLTNCCVLTEGFDAPATACIVIARPTRSRSLYLQMLGRGTRKAPGKTDCLVLDLVGATARHDMESVASAVGLPFDAELDTQSVAETFAHGFTRTQGEAVPLWKARPYAWVKTNVGYALGLGQDFGTLLLREHPLLGWGIYQLRRGKQHAFVTKASDLETAQNEAEELVRGLEVDRLVRRDEGWRSARASPGQLDALGKLGVQGLHARSLTRGGAADVLTKTITELAWRRG